MNIKIHEILEILKDFKQKREASKQRYQYINELREYLCRYYGYNHELMKEFMDIFSPNEVLLALNAPGNPLFGGERVAASSDYPNQHFKNQKKGVGSGFDPKRS